MELYNSYSPITMVIYIYHDRSILSTLKKHLKEFLRAISVIISIEFLDVLMEKKSVIFPWTVASQMTGGRRTQASAIGAWQLSGPDFSPENRNHIGTKPGIST